MNQKAEYYFLELHPDFRKQFCSDYWPGSKFEYSLNKDAYVDINHKVVFTPLNIIDFCKENNLAQ